MTPTNEASVEARAEFQAAVQPWLIACFGEMIAGDREERNHRFLEEALELVQACGCTASEAHQLVDYTYGRPVGELHQEVGGVMVTLAALCLANDADMHAAGWVELDRIWGKVEAIRAKQAAKPKHSPLPAITAALAPHVGEHGDGVREAFLNLIADASTFDEQPDEGGIYYKLEFTDASLIPLIKALGVEQQYRPLVVDDQTFAGLETPAEAICRTIDESAPAALSLVPQPVKEQEALCPVGFANSASDGSSRTTVAVTALSRDDAETALWQAIDAIRIGNKTDDKSILNNLADAGICLARLVPQPVKADGVRETLRTAIELLWEHAEGLAPRIQELEAALSPTATTGLDAATVEACAKVAGEHAGGLSIARGHDDDEGQSDRWYVGGLAAARSIATAIRALSHGDRA